MVCGLWTQLGMEPRPQQGEEREVFQPGYFQKPIPLPGPWRLGAGSLGMRSITHPHTLHCPKGFSSAVRWGPSPGPLKEGTLLLVLESG